MKIRKFIVAAMMLFAAAPAVLAQDMAVPNDTAVRTGKLANGLTYYVRQNNYPENRVNFYIAQRVGSIQEEESQRGLAHFLEHMAFNGSEHFNGEGKGVIDYTRNLGVQFGADLNAYTSVDQTVYNINEVPSARESALDSCLLILKDWSNGLLLEGDEIDKERGVIHEEWRLRSTAMQRMYERNLETMYPGSKYGKRMPIGLMSVIDNFKYNEIRDYYHKWYRPDNQAIVVVGDIDPDKTVEKIKKLFGTIPVPAADAAQVVDEPVPDNAEPIVIIDKDKEQQYSLVQLMFKHEPMPDQIKGNISYMMIMYAKSMMAQMLNNRLSEKAQEPDCPYLQAFAMDGQYIFSKTKDAFAMTALPKEGMTEQALNVLTTEAMRVKKHGFTATEYARAKSDYLSNLEKQYNNRSKISNERYGREYVANYLSNEPYASIETEYELMNMLAPNVPVEVINQLAASLISDTDNNLVIMNFNQEKEDAVYPTNAQLLGAVQTARTADIEAYVDNVKDEPLIKELPKPGKIVKETKSDKFDYTILTLSNGATVILKPTTFKDDEIVMQAESKGGSSLYGEADFPNTEIFDGVIMMSGLGEFSYTELDKALAGKNARVSLSLGNSYERAEGTSPKKDLETLFQLTYLKFTNIKKDQKSYDMIMSLIETELKNRSLEPANVFSDSVEYIMGNRSWRSKPFTVEMLKQVDYDRVLQIAKERYANAADFTFYFVGSFDEATIKPLIEQYIASLPAQKGVKENYKNVAEWPAGKVVNHFTRTMETPKAMANMFWYTLDAPYTLENSIKARVAGQVLDKIFLQKIREDAGAAYSPHANAYVQRVGDKVCTMMMGDVEMHPEKRDIALQIMRDAPNDMATSIDEVALKEIKELMVKRYDTSIKENGFWLNAISTWNTFGLDIVTGYKDIVNGLTPASISSFVKDVILKSGNSVEVFMIADDLTEKH